MFSLYIRVLLLFLSFSALATDDSQFLIGPIEPGSKILKYDVQKVLDSKLFEKSIAHNEKSIYPDFKVPQYFFHATKFWYYVYSVFGQRSLIFHDRDNLGIIYATFNLKAISTGLSWKQWLRRKDRFASKRKNEISNALNILSQGKVSCTLCQQILTNMRANGVEPPKNKKYWKIFFGNLKKNIRVQTGQKENIESGIKKFKLFKANILEAIRLFNVPKELISIAFLESSFNTSARSKVEATGVWQFMGRTGKYYMDVNKYVDQRLNPIISTYSALQLLKQNLKITKRWDLTIWSYNSGLSHIFRARKKLKNNSLTLPKLLRDYEHGHVGFASSNFFAEFLALVHFLSEMKLFNDSDVSPNELYSIYLNKCTLKPDYFFKHISDKNIRLMNGQFKRKKANLSKGKAFFSKAKLNSAKYFLLPKRYYTKRYPKNWSKLVKNQSCSIR